MRRFTLFLISCCAVLFASAQEEILFDSLPNQHPGSLTKQPVKNETMLFNGTAFPFEFNLLDKTVFDQPLIPAFNNNLDFLKYLSPLREVSHSYSLTGSAFHQVFPFGQVFNQSSYRLNDRIVVGGNSFGAQSVFDLPQLNSTIQDMSIKGASMFIEYKVNDRFKVQTRIGISSRGSAPWVP